MLFLLFHFGFAGYKEWGYWDETGKAEAMLVISRPLCPCPEIHAQAGPSQTLFELCPLLWGNSPKSHEDVSTWFTHFSFWTIFSIPETQDSLVQVEPCPFQGLHGQVPPLGPSSWETHLQAWEWAKGSCLLERWGHKVWVELWYVRCVPTRVCAKLLVVLERTRISKEEIRKASMCTPALQMLGVGLTKKKKKRPRDRSIFNGASFTRE